MKWDELHIDPELLRKYYSNQLNSKAKNALEVRALEDPFLKEAMDGFDENPGSFESFYQKYKRKVTIRKTYTFTIAVSVLLVLFITTTLIQLNSNNEIVLEPVINQISEPHTNNFNFNESKEVEVITPTIDSMDFIPTNEQITVKEVVKSQEKIAVLDKEKIVNEQVIVEEVIPDPAREFKPIKENWDWYGDHKKAIPTAYLFNLKVVDYREIKREREQITYKRFDIGGTAADRENEASSTELIETEVEIPYFSYLTKTMSFFDASDFKSALNRYVIILQQYPDDLNALFYSGLAYYNLGKFDKSISLFEQIITIDFEVFNQEAAWYRAKCLIQLGRKKEAVTALEDIIMKGGYYAKDAIEFKGKLK